MKPQYLALVVLFPLATLVSASPCDNGVERVSVSSTGVEGNNGSSQPAISAGGRFVAFASDATNLIADDANGVRDVFWHDRQTGVTVRVSRSSAGAQGNDWSEAPAISADGRCVAFVSNASNLVAGDTNGGIDIFVHDRLTGLTTRVSVATSGAQADDESFTPVISADGQVVAFQSWATNLHVLGSGGNAQIYVHDRVANRTTQCSAGAFLLPGNGDSSSPSMSADGNRIVFQSSATNLTTALDAPTVDIFLYERASGQVSRVNRGYGGALPNNGCANPAISADGAWVAYQSTATNLIAGGTLGQLQIFLQEVAGSSPSIVSVHTNGSHGSGTSSSPSISNDGTRVAFWSQASNLIPGDTIDSYDVFIHDVSTGTTACMTRDSSGQLQGGAGPALAAGGAFIAFSSPASGFVPGDTNGDHDVFVRDYGVQSRNAGANPWSYRASRTVLGEEWRGSVDLTTTGHAFAVLYAKVGPANAALGGGQRLLIGGQTLFKLPAQPGPVATWSGLVPNDPGLFGVRLYTQAVQLLGVAPFALSNAQDLCLGY